MYSSSITLLVASVLAIFATTTHGAETTPTNNAATGTVSNPTSLEGWSYPNFPEIEVEITYANLTASEIAEINSASSESAPKSFRARQVLDKRSQRPDVCWGFVAGLGHTRNTYIADLERLRQHLSNSGTFRTMYAMSTVTVTLGAAKLVIQNTDTCAVNVVSDSTMAYYVRQFQDFCYDQKGWILRDGIRFIRFQADQNGQPPPQYSPRCNYY